MGIERVNATLEALKNCGIRSERGYPARKMVTPETPVAAVNLSRVSDQGSAVKIRIYAGDGIACEDAAVAAVEALRAIGAACTLEECAFQQKAGVFFSEITAFWGKALCCQVFLNTAVLENVTDFQARQMIRLNTAEAIGEGVVDVARESLGWTITVEQLLSPETAPPQLSDSSFTLKVVRAGGTEQYSNCRWESVSRQDTSEGVRQIRVARTWEERVISIG